MCSDVLLYSGVWKLNVLAIALEVIMNSVLKFLVQSVHAYFLPHTLLLSSLLVEVTLDYFNRLLSQRVAQWVDKLSGESLWLWLDYQSKVTICFYMKWVRI